MSRVSGTAREIRQLGSSQNHKYSSLTSLPVSLVCPRTWKGPSIITSSMVLLTSMRSAAFRTRHTHTRTDRGLREIRFNDHMEDVYAYGSSNDNAERLEFSQEHILLSCGSPRFYRIVADRLLHKADALRQDVDCALLCYTLALVSFENDEMTVDAPGRALNKVFARLKRNCNTDRERVELIFTLQQIVFDRLEYLEGNKRKLPIWGAFPFGNHHVSFHPEHTSASIRCS